MIQSCLAYVIQKAVQSILARLHFFHVPVRTDLYRQREPDILLTRKDHQLSSALLPSQSIHFCDHVQVKWRTNQEELNTAIEIISHPRVFIPEKEEKAL
jgi:hypothetical protein